MERKRRKKFRIIPPIGSVEFSKWLLIQESLLIWINTISFIILAFVCVQNQFFGELPWLTAMASLPWVAYGTSQAFYYRKATAENTLGGIKYDSIVGGTKEDDEVLG